MADISDKTETRYIYNGTLSFIVYRSSRTRTGYRGPRQYTKLGNLAAHPVIYSVTERHSRPVAHVTTGSPVSQVPTKVPGWFLGIANTSAQALINEATVKFYQRAANTNAMLPLMLKERQQTIDMVSEKVLKLVAIKRNFLKEMRKSWKRNDHTIVQQRWLEYRYGWIPTLMDIDTLVNQPLGVPGTVCEGRAFQRYEINGYKDSTGNYDQNGHVSARVQALLIARSPFQKTATQYGIANPSLVAWEMVPYSFVVDWVFDVGGYLEHLGALNGLELINPVNSYSHVFHQQNFISARTGLTSGYTSYKGKHGERKVGIPKYPNPFIPNNGMNLSRFFDAAALLKGQFDRFRR